MRLLQSLLLATILLMTSRLSSRAFGESDINAPTDYAAAINAHFSQGVTVQNNAAVDLISLLDLVSPGQMAQVCQALAIPQPAQDSPRFVLLGNPKQTLAEAQKLADQLNKATSRPWDAKEFPTIADWLNSNDKVLNLISTASQKPRFYWPLISEKDTLLVHQDFPETQSLQDVALALEARSMRRLQGHDLPAAQQDLLAVHRVARLEAQRPLLLLFLGGLGMDTATAQPEIQLASADGWTAVQAAQARQNLQSLGPIANFADVLNFGERLFVQDAIAWMPHHRYQQITEELFAGSNWPLLKDSAFNSINWTQVSQAQNQSLDEILTIYSQPIPQHAAAVGAATQPAPAAPSPPHENATEEFIDLMKGQLQSSYLPAIAYTDLGRQLFDLQIVAYAMAQYRADRHRLPEGLAELVPNYIPALPADRFTNGQSLQYDVKNDSCRIYSVGPNGRDDTNPPQPNGDDIVIEMAWK